MKFVKLIIFIIVMLIGASVLADNNYSYRDAARKSTISDVKKLLEQERSGVLKLTDSAKNTFDLFLSGEASEKDVKNESKNLLKNKNLNLLGSARIRLEQIIGR